MMGNSKKNSTAAELGRLHDVDQISDSPLGDENDLVYELVEEEEAIIESSHTEKIKQLQHTQKSIRHQLDDAFLDIDKLTRQFKKEKQTRQASLTSYIALMIGGVAFIIALGAVYFLSDSQEGVDKLTRSIETLKDHNHTKTGESFSSQLEDLQLKVDNLVNQQKTLSSTNTVATDNVAAKKNTPEDPLTFTGSGIPAATETTAIPSVDTNTTSASDVKPETPASEMVVIEVDQVVEDQVVEDQKEMVVDPFSATTTEASSPSTTDNITPVAVSSDDSLAKETETVPVVETPVAVDSSAIKAVTEVKEETPVDSLKVIEPNPSALTTSLLPAGTPSTDDSLTKETETVPVLETITPAVDTLAVKETIEVKEETPVDSLKMIEPDPSALTTNLLPTGTPSSDTSNAKKATTGENPTLTSTVATTETESPSLSDTLLKQEKAESSASEVNNAIEVTAESALKTTDVDASDSKKETETDALKSTESSAKKPVSLSDTLLKQESSVTTTPDEKATTLEETENTSQTEKPADNLETVEVAIAEKTLPRLEPTEKTPETDKKEDTPETSTPIKNGWVVILGSYKNISRAQRSMDTYNKKGFTTSINKIRSGGRSWHQISTTLFRTKNEAKQHLRQMKRKVKIESSMIIRR